jgi:2,3,4,5-tetrahydropyridine-2-carboxylate N-succinyltransferase|tara:strand:- start:1 stop:825 length:825 start_codon:yes stop_codon:yes gene_type:complete
MINNYEQLITKAFATNISSSKDLADIKNIVDQVLDQLDSGQLRVSEKIKGEWVVNEWVKKAILLSFKTNENHTLSGPYATWFDKVEGKTVGWDHEKYSNSGFRYVPNGVIRKSAFIAKDCVIMPSFINVGAYVDQGTMIDTWSTIGSCAQIGKKCHISGGVGIGGVLEPLQANPVIIEDNCFVGARSEIAEGVIVEEGSVISMGVFIGSSTKIVDRETGNIYYGRVPSYSVVVPGTLPSEKMGEEGLSLYCAVIVKRVDEKTRSKTSINELLRA